MWPWASDLDKEAAEYVERQLGPMPKQPHITDPIGVVIILWLVFALVFALVCNIGLAYSTPFLIGSVIVGVGQYLARNSEYKRWMTAHYNYCQQREKELRESRDS